MNESVNEESKDSRREDRATPDLFDANLNHPQTMATEPSPLPDNDTATAATEATPIATLESLSMDLLGGQVLSYLQLTEINAASLASQRLCQASRSNALWKVLFARRWKMDDRTFRALWRGQNWYLAYQEAYNNPDDLWIFHWNCVYPEDGLVSGRCCIYDDDGTSNKTNRISEARKKARDDLCPPCRFFPEHPLKQYAASVAEKKSNKDVTPKRNTNNAERIAQTTDDMIHDFCQEHDVSKGKHLNSYTASKAKAAFARSSTFHRTLDTRQYTAAPPYAQADSPSSPLSTTVTAAVTAHASPLKDLLFFNVTEEPLSTKFGRAELDHLRQERNAQQEWEQTSVHSRDRRNVAEFSKPAYETAHHTWHQAVVTNPDFCRPIVFRLSIQRPDCFTVFPSEGFLEAGQSVVITFGVRPLGSLVATAFDTINAQRHDGVEAWIQQVHNEEGPLPYVPFVLQYKYSSVIPCLPARGYISPHRPQPRHEEDNTNTTAANATTDNDGSGNAAAATYPDVADLCWQQKQIIDFHWSGGDPTALAVEQHEVRSIYLSGHVNASYPFSQFCADTLTPFDLVVDPKEINQGSHTRQQEEPQSSPMLYFAAPQLYEFYQKSVYSHLQRVQLETEASHAGHVFRSHRKRCPGCRRTSWGPRLEELGQAFVKSKLEIWLWQTRQTALLQNCATIIRSVYTSYQNHEQQNESDEPVSCEKGGTAARARQALFVALQMLLRYRSAPFIGKRYRADLTRQEIIADLLYRIYSVQLAGQPSQGINIPWRQSGNYRYQICTDSLFNPSHSLTMGHECWEEHLKDEPRTMRTFRRLIETPGKFNFGPQEDPNHLGEIAPSRGWWLSADQQGYCTDMFMDGPLRSLQVALITLSNPRSVVGHGVYDRINYPGKVVRRPRFPTWSRHLNHAEKCPEAQLTPREEYFRLQDSLCFDLVPKSAQSMYQTYSMRRYLRNIPPMGMGCFPLSIDSGAIPGYDDKPSEDEEKNAEPREEIEQNTAGDNSSTASVLFLTTSHLVPICVPVLQEETALSRESHTETSSLTLRTEAFYRTYQRPDEVRHQGVAANNANENLANLPGVNPPLMRGPGPRLLNLLWSVSAQLGWSVDDPGQTASSVVVNRKLLIGVQWLSLTLMAAPLVLTLGARSMYLVPCKPVDYYLEDLPYPLVSELRFLSETECGAAAFLLIVFWLFLGRWTERWIRRDFTRAMIEHINEPSKNSSTLLGRLSLRYKRQWDSICPLFLQRLTYSPQWNGRQMCDLMKHIAFWRSQYLREYSSIFQATAGRGMMFCNDRWRELDVRDESSRKLLFAVVSSVGSFNSSTPYFWMNLLTVFSCSISLGLSVSLRSLESGISGAAFGNLGSLLKSLNLATLVILSFLLGQLLGSSGGVLFLAEFVVTSISFILGGAGTISASSVESWSCFFFLSSTAFWGYLFGRVALMDGIIRQKRFVKGNLFTTTLMCASLGAVLAVGGMMFLWPWDVPASLVILRPGMAKTARGARDASAAAGRNAARRTASVYAAKHLQ